jgi:hypothetical protein
MIRALALAIFALLLATPAAAQSSNCYAFVEGVPGIRYVTLGPVATNAREVTITYVGHSTFRIETEEGVVIATDYFGASGEGRLARRGDHEPGPGEPFHQHARPRHPPCAARLEPGWPS